MPKKEPKIKSTSDNFIQWEAPEFVHYQKDVSWYWLSLIIAVILLALAVWQGSFLFLVFIIISWLVIVYSTGRSPAIWNFKIDEGGVAINLPKTKEAQKFFSYREIDGFDIHSVNDAYKQLVLKTKSRFSPYVKINFPASEEEKINNFLQRYLSKEEYGESLADSFSKLIRF